MNKIKTDPNEKAEETTSFLSRGELGDAAYKCAWSHIPELATLTDEEFVYFVRASERQHPDFASLVVWVDAVRRELDLRLLLKSNPEIK